ncbi:MBL fold metallo-hydrolase [Saccharomonospora iraqiensis]|uniref:MBL fold metallo-hydrolase n=1 Tax=Saccharomonospora iraqiensis TaxID=52698 RepID=UPI000422F9A6|nr:MBL fold metallo-hydrolase [Saccharomonospora iraqiensis]
MRTVLLGAKGGPRLLADRCGPGQLVEHDGTTVLIDAGEGVVAQILRSGRDLSELDAVFVTHHHCDHNVALGNVLMGYWVSGGQRPITVSGPPPLGRIVGDLLAAHAEDIATRVRDEGRSDLRDLVRVREISVDTPPRTGTAASAGPFTVGSLTVTAAPVYHPPMPALGYRVTDDAGTAVVVSGDTAPCASLVELARDAEVLIHEVLHPDFLRPGAASGNTRWPALRRHLLRSHTSVYDLGRVATDAGVGTLVLSHQVPGRGVSERQWLTPVRARFDGTVLVGDDLMRLESTPSWR